MFALTPAFVLVALAVSAAAGPVPGRQAPFAVAKRDDGSDAFIDLDVFSTDPSEARVVDVNVGNDRAPRLNSRLFDKRTSYYVTPEGGILALDDAPASLLSVDVGGSHDDREAGLLGLGILRRQTTGDIISPGPSGQSDADDVDDVLAQARTMRARAFRATVNKQKAKAKGTAHKVKTVTTNPSKVKAVVAQQLPPVVAQAAAESTPTTTTLVPVDTDDRGALLDLDLGLGLGHQREPVAYSQAAVAVVAPASAVAAAAPVPTSSTGSKANNGGLVFDPSDISTKFAQPGAKVKAVTGQDPSSVTAAAAPAATTLYTVTNGNPTNGSLLDLDVDL